MTGPPIEAPVWIRWVGAMAATPDLRPAGGDLLANQIHPVIRLHRKAIAHSAVREQRWHVRTSHQRPVGTRRGRVCLDGRSV